MRTLRTAVLSVVLLLAPSTAFAERSCPPPPCDLKKESRSACEGKATWVLEGTVEALIDDYGRHCQRFGDLRECLAPSWTGAVVHLRELTAVKMPIRMIIDGPPIFTGYGNATVASANGCWGDTVRLPPTTPTRRVRFYGMEKYQNPSSQLHGWSPSMSRDGGYFAYELIK